MSNKGRIIKHVIELLEKRETKQFKYITVIRDTFLRSAHYFLIKPMHWIWQKTSLWCGINSQQLFIYLDEIKKRSQYVLYSGSNSSQISFLDLPLCSCLLLESMVQQQPEQNDKQKHKLPVLFAKCILGVDVYEILYT